jgi:DNA-binding MarR family transcriptional regulator
MLHDPTTNRLVPLIKRLHLATRRAYDDAFAAYRLTGPQANVLRFVWLQDGIEQRELQERLGVTGATLTGIIDGLVERELVERRLSPDDARVKQLFLTERGRAVSDDLGGILVRLHDQLVQGFSPTEQALLGDWLQRMAANMDALAGDDCG